MGWASGGAHFNDVADALISAGASDEIKTKVCSALISSLGYGDWDTQGESLGEYEDDPAIVQAFREHGFFVENCEAPGPDPKRPWDTCRKEAGHEDDHGNRAGSTWPNEK
jgi:hypothetical protein